VTQFLVTQYVYTHTHSIGHAPTHSHKSYGATQMFPPTNVPVRVSAWASLSNLIDKFLFGRRAALMGQRLVACIDQTCALQLLIAALGRDLLTKVALKAGTKQALRAYKSSPSNGGSHLRFLCCPP